MADPHWGQQMIAAAVVALGTVLVLGPLYLMGWFRKDKDWDK